GTATINTDFFTPVKNIMLPMQINIRCMSMYDGFIYLQVRIKECPSDPDQIMLIGILPVIKFGIDSRMHKYVILILDIITQPTHKLDDIFIFLYKLIIPRFPCSRVLRVDVNIP